MNKQELMMNAKTRFLRCKDGIAYYALTVPYNEGLYSFPVPLTKVKEEVLAAESNTIHFMEFIHEAIHDGTLTKEAA